MDNNLYRWGSYRIKGDAAKDATLSALQSGYTSIDTATSYGNHGDIRDAIKESGTPLFCDNVDGFAPHSRLVNL